VVVKKAHWEKKKKKKKKKISGEESPPEPGENQIPYRKEGFSKELNLKGYCSITSKNKTK